MPWYYWLLVPATYLLGSISFAYWAGRIRGKDLRKEGSGNLGATNAGRVLGKAWFFIIFTLDLAKGLVPVVLAQQLDVMRVAVPDGPTVMQSGGWLVMATAVAAILGHSFTCFHGFKGGKAVATSLGVLIALVWPVAVACFVVWLLVWTVGVSAFGAKFAEAVGPASVLAAIAAPIAHLATCPGRPWQPPYVFITVFVIAVSCLVVVRHRSNIAKMFGRSGS